MTHHEPPAVGSYRLHYEDVDGKPNPNNGVIHVRAIVDGNQVIVRRWRRGHWHYYVETPYWFWLAEKHGHLTRIR